jgi:hypothetical protein
LSRFDRLQVSLMMLLGKHIHYIQSTHKCVHTLHTSMHACIHTYIHTYIQTDTQQNQLKLESSASGCLPLHITSFTYAPAGPHTHKDSRYNPNYTPEIHVTWSTITQHHAFSIVFPPPPFRPVAH